MGIVPSQDTLSRRPVILTFLPVYLPGYKRGGAIRTIANMVDRMGGIFQFKIFTSDRDRYDAHSYPGIAVNEWTKVGNAMVYYCSPEKLSSFTIYKILRVTQYDLLYFNSFFAPRFTLVPILLRWLKLIPQKGTVVAPRGEFSNGALKLKYYKKRIFINLSRSLKLYRGVTWQASTSREKLDILNNYGGVSRTATEERIAIAEDLPPLCNALPARIDAKQKGRLNIVFLSRICRMKNLSFALDMLGKLTARISFHIYGPLEDVDYWKQCEHLIASLPKNVEARYLGTIDHDKVVDTFAKYDLFFFPTLGENFGHVIWEALIAGCPVLISDQAPWRGLREMGVGWDFPLSEPAKFREAIASCVDMDHDEYLSWSMRARNYAISKMHSNEAVGMNIDLFRSVLSEVSRNYGQNRHD